MNFPIFDSIHVTAEGGYGNKKYNPRIKTSEKSPPEISMHTMKKTPTRNETNANDNSNYILLYSLDQYSNINYYNSKYDIIWLYG